MQSWNILNQNVVLSCIMESFNTEMIYNRGPKQPPQEMHSWRDFGCTFIQHCNRNYIITIYKNRCVAPHLAATGSREVNTNSFLIINAEVRKTINQKPISFKKSNWRGKKGAKKYLNTGILIKNCYWMVGTKSHTTLKR